MTKLKEILIGVYNKFNLLSKQLSEDKALFKFLITNNMITEEGEKLIQELIDKQSKELE